MKRGLLFSLAGLSLLLAQAQDLPDSMTYWREDASQELVAAGSVYFDYDVSGRILSRTLSNDGFGRAFREEYVYDANGNQLHYRRLRRFAGDPDFIIIDSSAYQYNMDQLLVRRVSFYTSFPSGLIFSDADSFAYGKDINNRVNYREEYYASNLVGGAMDWISERRDSVFYHGSDSLPSRMHGYTWNQDSGRYIHTLIQDSLRWELGCDFGFNFYPSDHIYYQLDSLGVFQNFARRITSGPSGRIETQVQLVKFPTIGFDTTALLRFTWDNRGVLKLKETYIKSQGVLTINSRILDSLVYTFNRVTGRYLLYENPGHRIVEYYSYHYSTVGVEAVGEQINGFFPNPVRQGQQLFLQPETVVLGIVSVSGQEQTEWSYEQQSLRHNFAPGVYLVRMQQADRIFVQRLQVIP